ncbi:MAG TPA: patatin-like protein [Acidimicrobiales bacterium]|nr:patatin-like protein [Acidimicrobiales bacterium]
MSAGTQEIRIASAMTGGVSLAIWMGGVAREMNLLDQASRARRDPTTTDGFSVGDAAVRDLYRRLLELLDVVVAIDVLSGTSAGGINAALLGVCAARGVDLGPLRDIWLETGAFDTLLRNPQQKGPPSLLQGDGVLLDGLVTGLTRLTATAGGAPPPVPTKVFITTTLLTPETSRFTDDYGTLVPDVDHHGRFAFAGDDFQAALPAIALAARASASFPGAFEPAFIPFTEAVAATEGPSSRPAMAEFTNLTTPHWAADGGILANRPIGPLLQAVFDAPAYGQQIRRVLLYVVPDPGGVPDPKAVPPVEAIDKPLLLAEALRKDLGAALNHSISADLRAIRRHNDNVVGRADARLRLAELGCQFCRGQLVTDAGWAAYARRESERLAIPVIQAIMRAITTVRVPTGWVAELAAGQNPETVCRDEAAAAIRAAWVPPAVGDYCGLAALGRSAFEGARITVLSVLRMAYPLATGADQRVMLAGLSHQAHQAFVAAVAGNVDHDAFQAVSIAAQGNDTGSLASFSTVQATSAVAAQALGECETPDVPSTVPAGLAQGWWSLATLVVAARPQLQALIDGHAAPPAGAPGLTGGPAAAAPPAGPAGLAAPPGSAGRRRADAAQQVATYLAYLGSDRDVAAARLLSLYVAERSMLPIDVDVDQPVELIQVSSNTRCLLDLSRTDAAAKLTGTQIHHFGAFYKASWRANDWMWGRLDGAGWLVHVLLDPRRIGALHREGGKDAFRARLAAIAGPVPDIAIGADHGSLGTPLAAAIDQELAFLDDDLVPVPVSLPATSLWVARAVQELIAARELVEVASQMLRQPGRGDGSWPTDVLNAAGTAAHATAAAQAAVAAVADGRSPRAATKEVRAAASSQGHGAAAIGDPTQVVALLRSNPVCRQTFGDELGSPLLTKTLAKAVAVVAAVIPAAVANPPSALTPLFSTLRTVTLTGYRAVNVTGTAPRRMIFGGVGLTAVGFVLASRQSTVLGFTGGVMMLVGLYLAVFGAWSFKRGLLSALAAVTAVAALVIACLPATRDWLLGRENNSNQGWVVRTVLPWLRNSWWGLLAVLGFVVLVSVAISYLRRLAGGRLARRPSTL